MVPRNDEPGSDDGEARRARAGVPAHAQCVVPELTPVRAGGGRGRHRMRRLLHRRRHFTAAGLAVAAAAMAAFAPRGDRGETRPGPEKETAAASAGAAQKAHGRSPGGRARPAPDVSAPVRIADAATVALLRPGDRVDVIAGTDEPGRARVVARGALVDRVPKSVETDPADGALVVLKVPRGTATALAGTAVDGRLAVTLC